MIKVLVIFGGMSSEHSISCLSASNVLENIDKNKYDITKIGIDKLGDWFKYTGSNENIKENKWKEDANNKYKITDILVELKKYDCIFPVLHGKYGEDGTIQGVFELAKIPYIGCDTEGSSIAMDKIISKELVKNIGINVVEYFYLNKYENITNEKLEKLININNLNYPLIVKPNKEGSSYGVSKVNNIDELNKAIKFSFEFDDKILIEKYISNRKEIECAVLGEKTLHISTPGEILSANEFYDFNSKYENNKSSNQIPANVDLNILNEIKTYAFKIFNVLRLRGISRVDFFFDTKENKVYFNEVNTLPGFTNISMYPKMLEYDGIEYSQIIDKLITYALER
ncbi:MAG: D-alanine--D-alanine ligase family protein [Clostridia bacterium]